MSITYKRNFHYVAMPIMASQILKPVDFTENKKSSRLENETLFFLQTKKFIRYTARATLWQKVILQRR